MTHVYIGCDISKERLDLFDPRIAANSAHANSPAGILALFEACGPDAILVFEVEADQRSVRGTDIPPRIGLRPGLAGGLCQGQSALCAAQSAACLAFRPVAEPAQDRPG